MKASYITNDDTICALATAAGSAAIALIRMSGEDSLKIISRIFHPANKNFKEFKPFRINFGKIQDGKTLVDEVICSYFKAPHSYSGEDIIEISCHGSEFIQEKIIQLLISCGARLAKPGEFTLRAFLNGKLDLSQAEAVADLISSNSDASHNLALKQMRGAYSEKIKDLRKQLLDFASLIELELDFSEEDVEFADREKLIQLLNILDSEISILIKSFEQGNVLKKGIPVAIAGKPNVGKSTLLNAILNDEKAIVSDIPGTTRDAIEDSIIIDGLAFRFIDTAGLRDSDDIIENLGIDRAYQNVQKAKIILFVFDLSIDSCEQVLKDVDKLKEKLESNNNGFDPEVILIANKTDKLIETPKEFKKLVDYDCIFISAKRKENISLITDRLLKLVKQKPSESIIVSNTRHFEALSKALESIKSIISGFSEGLPTDLISIDIRRALDQLGEITGEITNDEILHNIFRNFCIGK
ncbi:tRNA uridine-5-carboxymethylaminomethyl(34) synthesis GTPase MnmE [Bacteroidota bacterium]